MVEKFQIQYDDGCHHCPCNPKAQKPYIQKPVIEYTPLTKKLLPMIAEQAYLPQECLVCLSLVTLWCYPFLQNEPKNDLSKYR